MATKAKAENTTAVSEVTPGGKATVYEPFGGRMDLGEEAERPVPEHVTLSWATGLDAQRMRMDEESGEEVPEDFKFKGFFFDDEDQQLNEAARIAGLEKVAIFHEGDGAWRNHWILPRGALYIVTKGWQSRKTMEKTNERKGIAYGRRYPRTKDGKLISTQVKYSYLFLQVVPEKLLRAGYEKPLILSLNKTQTDDAIALLTAQYKVLIAAHDYLKSIGKDRALPFWTYAIGAGPSKNKVERKGPKGSSWIHVVVPVMPMQLDEQYFQTMEVPVQYIDLFKELAEASETWSTSVVTDFAQRDEDDAANVGNPPPPPPSQAANEQSNDDFDPFLDN